MNLKQKLARLGAIHPLGTPATARTGGGVSVAVRDPQIGRPVAPTQLPTAPGLQETLVLEARGAPAERSSGESEPSHVTPPGSSAQKVPSVPASLTRTDGSPLASPTPTTSPSNALRTAAGALPASPKEEQPRLSLEASVSQALKATALKRLQALRGVTAATGPAAPRKLDEAGETSPPAAPADSEPRRAAATEFALREPSEDLPGAAACTVAGGASEALGTAAQLQTGSAAQRTQAAPPTVSPSASNATSGERIRRGLAALPPRTAPVALPSPPSVAPKVESREALPVEAVHTAAGLLHLRALPHPVEHRHGSVQLARATQVLASTVAKLALDPSLEGIDYSRALFLDLETTGLAGGTGTLPVVIGLAWFDGQAFQMEQLFLRRPGEERPMLARVAERLTAASSVVTYNGKTFDWPLLRSRFVMNRMSAPTPPPHLDLLHCARRVFRWRGSGTRLADIEREVIGHRRIGDVEGSQIPELYFRYLRSGNAGPLVPVLEHNVYDIRLLAALLAHLAEQFDAPAADGDLRDLLGLGQVAFRADDFDRAGQFALRAAASSALEISAEALMLSARVSLRQGDAKTASASLESALRKCRQDVRADLHLALAKIYEHRLRDFSAALRHAARTGRAETDKERGRRTERLQRRAERAASSV